MSTPAKSPSLITDGVLGSSLRCPPGLSSMFFFFSLVTTPCRLSPATLTLSADQGLELATG